MERQFHLAQSASKFAPRGTENVSSPAGPGKSAREQQGRDLGASARGIFMQLDGLIVVDVAQPEERMRNLRYTLQIGRSGLGEPGSRCFLVWHSQETSYGNGQEGG